MTPALASRVAVNGDPYYRAGDIAYDCGKRQNHHLQNLYQNEHKHTPFPRRAYQIYHCLNFFFIRRVSVEVCENAEQNKNAEQKSGNQLRNKSYFDDKFLFKK